MADSGRQRMGNPFRELIERPNEALEAIYVRHGGRLSRYIRHFIYDDDMLVQDVIMETLTVVWKRRELVATLDEPYFWMQAVAKHIALHKLRTERKYDRETLSAYEDIADGFSVDQKHRIEEIEQQILEASATLTARERTLFLASRFEGLSNKELMQRYGLAEQTVKNNLTQALRKIREKLKHLLRLFI